MTVKADVLNDNLLSDAWEIFLYDHLNDKWRYVSYQYM